MADPICRWRNTTVKQVCEFSEILPHKTMPKEEARDLIEKNWNQWDGSSNFFRTPYQLAAQLGMYYEDDKFLYPRFDHVVSLQEAEHYIREWLKLYYVPNPYTPSIKFSQSPIVLYSALLEELKDKPEGIDLSDFFKRRLGIELGNSDILANLLARFSSFQIENGTIKNIGESNYDVPVATSNKCNDKKAFFDTFNRIIPFTQNNAPDELNGKNKSLQVIYYGAPGTGKSHTINVETKGKNVIRTTFHPDSDYSTFVGAYKPTTKESYVRDSTGRIVVEDGKKVTEDRIVYEFVEQAFLQAYINAWKLYAEASDGAHPEEQYLVIEEINRGNCAQIFGDLFQLLDRKDNGFSEYPITADKDMQKHLAKAFAGMDIPNAAAIDDMYDEPGMSERIKNGEVLLFPSNLYIWATMNTSDQSLFPIDSAFKRRWEWKYMPIHNAEKNWRIAVNGSEYDWWQFLEKVNDYIGSTTNSEDKKLGYFFCKPKDGIITADTFVGKVIFYLWNDVFKDYGLDGDLFKGADGSALTFDKFYVADAKAIREDNVNQFLTNLGLQPVDSSSAPEESEDISNESQSLKDKYLNFWLGFNDSYEQSGEFKDAFTNPKGLAQTWLNIGGLNRSYYIALVVSGKNKVANVQLYFSKGESVFDKYKEHFDEIKERFEQDNTTSVTLHEAQKNKYIQASIPFDMEHEDWNTAYNWFHEKAVLFKELCDEIDPKE
jgi:5-methylcytosine-specific restriction protein B